MSENKCKNCKYFDSSKLTVLEVGVCRRFPKYVERQRFEFCGEFKNLIDKIEIR